MNMIRYTNRTLYIMGVTLAALVVGLIIIIALIVSAAAKQKDSRSQNDVAVMEEAMIDVTASNGAPTAITLDDLNAKEFLQERDNINLSIQMPETVQPDVPYFYTRIYPDHVNVPVYAFVDQDGTIQYRVYVEREFYSGSMILKRDSGFIAVSIELDEGISKINVISNNLILNWDEHPGVVKPEQPAFGDIPDSIKSVNGKLFSYKEDDETHYCVYGSLDGVEYHYWESDENGNMKPGSLYLSNIK